MTEVKKIYRISFDIEASDRNKLVTRKDIDKLILDKRTISFSLKEIKEESKSGT